MNTEPGWRERVARALVVGQRSGVSAQLIPLYRVGVEDAKTSGDDGGVRWCRIIKEEPI